VTSGLNHYYFTRERIRAEGQLEVAQEQARTDPLTRLANRRGMVEALSAAPVDRPYAIALIDLDRFKEVNDTLGHAHGDAVLAEIAGILNDVIGEMGIVSRWGGEEFLVFMTDVRLTAAVAGVERARKAVEVLVREERGDAGVTFSAGLAAAPAGFSWETAVRVADALLYDAKDAGRNRVRYAQVRGDMSEWDG
jgi:diguanylate cyclase (GGDEF)-like protein